jgi:hypothetical protein
MIAAPLNVTLMENGSGCITQVAADAVDEPVAQARDSAHTRPAYRSFDRTMLNSDPSCPLNCAAFGYATARVSFAASLKVS